ncbi:hypothetical protein [Actinacidiphila acididurans]|uniref:WXG100 family type VII secretion target n=1 Tax=Actinacidiphila acididurans TaxID=2784346 RepID=A0ABS2TV11_9ACTN|nr:hypothetical protein [Actinacidiphila acididurans]MBM9506821.1 hypothetical protein [Actinacidiphila acididurans]
MTDLNVDPGELRVSAHMVDTVNGRDLDDRIKQALASTNAVAQALSGWTVRTEADAVADTWQPALRGLQERMSAAADALRQCATSHEWNETLMGRDFEGIG